MGFGQGSIVRPQIIRSAREQALELEIENLKKQIEDQSHRIKVLSKNIDLYYRALSRWQQSFEDMTIEIAGVLALSE